MKKNQYRCYSLTYFRITRFQSFFQTDKTKLQYHFANTQILQQNNTKPDETENQQIEDSIKKIQLQTPPSCINTTDNFKKEDLQNHLQQLIQKMLQGYNNYSFRLFAKGLHSSIL